MLSIIIFIFMVVLLIWDKFPMAISALLGCVLMVVFGVCGPETVFAPFASTTIVLTVGVMVIGEAISETGLADLIGEKIIEISKGSERRLIFGCYFTAAFLSMFLNNSAVLAIFIPIVMGLSNTNGKIQPKNVLMPIAIASVLGGGATLAGSTQQLVSQGFLEDLGLRTFSMFTLTPIGFTLVVLGGIYCLLIGYPRGKKIWGDEALINAKYEEKAHHTYDRRHIFIMAGIFLLTVVLYSTSWLPLAVTSTLGALLCIITGCISEKKAIQAVNWDLIGRLGGCLGAAQAMEAGGGAEIVSAFFGRIVGNNIHPYLLFIIFVLLTQFITQFVSASVVLTVVLPILISIVQPMGLNTFTYVLGVTLAAPMLMSNPLASTALGFSMTIGYKFRDYFRYSIFLDLLGSITICILVPALYGLIGPGIL